MHTDLSPHLHTPACRVLIEQLKECHQTNKFTKFLGACNEIDNLVTKCCKRERQQRQKGNYQKSIEKQTLLKERLKQKDLE